MDRESWFVNRGSWFVNRDSWIVNRVSQVEFLVLSFELEARLRSSFDLTGFGGLVILRAASWNKYNGFEKKNVSE